MNCKVFFNLIFSILSCFQLNFAHANDLKPNLEAWINEMPARHEEKKLPPDDLPLIVLIDLGSKELVLKQAILKYEGKQWKTSNITKQGNKFRIDGRTKWVAGSNLSIELFVLDMRTKKETRIESSTPLRSAN